MANHQKNHHGCSSVRLTTNFVKATLGMVVNGGGAPPKQEEESATVPS